MKFIFELQTIRTADEIVIGNIDVDILKLFILVDGWPPKWFKTQNKVTPQAFFIHCHAHALILF